MAAFEGLIDASIDHKVIIAGTGLCNLPKIIAISRHAVGLDCAAVDVATISLQGLGRRRIFRLHNRIRFLLHLHILLVPLRSTPA